MKDINLTTSGRLFAGIVQDDAKMTGDDEEVVPPGAMLVPGAHGAGAKRHVDDLLDRALDDLPIRTVELGGDAICGDDVTDFPDLDAVDQPALQQPVAIDVRGVLPGMTGGGRVVGRVCGHA